MTKTDYVVTAEEVIIPSGNNNLRGTLYRPTTDKKTPLIIMCHGYNGVGDDFKNEGELFARNGIAAYTTDFCGGSVRSKSDGDTRDMTIFTEKENLLNAYDHFIRCEYIDFSNIFLFGGSQGGLVTTLVTEELGDRVRGMALYYPALCIADNWRKTYPDVEMIPEIKEFWGMTLGKCFFESIHDLRVFEEIGSYPNNVLIIHGDEDEIVDLSYSEKAISLYKKAKLIVMKGEGHGFQPEAGKAAGEALLNFVKENIR